MGKEGSGEKQLGQRVVKGLTQLLKVKNHHVFFDNFFTSEQLLQDLLDDGILACGTAKGISNNPEGSEIEEQVRGCV